MPQPLTVVPSHSWTIPPLDSKSAPEVCGGVDNDQDDQDGQVDEGYPNTNTGREADCHDDDFDGTGNADSKATMLDIMEYFACGQYGRNCPYGP